MPVPVARLGAAVYVDGVGSTGVFVIVDELILLDEIPLPPYPLL